MIFLFDEKNEPKDIFADIPSEKPVDRPPMSLQSPGSAPANPAASGVVRQQGTFSKKWIFIPVAVLVLGGAAYAAYSYLAPKTPAAAVPTPVVPTSPSTVTPPATTEPLPVTPTAPTTEVAPPPAVLNTAPGAATGTPASPTAPESGTSTSAVSSATSSPAVSPDSDGDGLTDYQEVCIYGTNPLNPDTDGDGYQDGAEVKSGYNPNGPGKLVLPLPTISNPVCQRASSSTTP